MNETAAFVIFMAMTSTAVNHQAARIGSYQADDVLRYMTNKETCEQNKGTFESTDGSCSVSMPGGRVISLSILDRRVVVRIETKYETGPGEKVMTDFTGVVIDQYRDALIVQQAILRDSSTVHRNQEGLGLPVIERAGRGGCRLTLQFLDNGKLDIVPSSRCDHRLAITGAAKIP